MSRIIDVAEKQNKDSISKPRNGLGTFVYPDGRIYVGEFKGGEFHGQGTFTFSDGGKYVGELKGNNRWKGTQYDKYGGVKAIFSDGIRFVHFLFDEDGNPTAVYSD